MIGLELSPGYTRTALLPPLAGFFVPGEGQRVALADGPADTLSVWTEIGEGFAAQMRLDANDPANRYSWRETLVAALRNVYPIGALTLSSGWSQLQSSGSGLQASYTGNRAISTSSGSAEATVTVDADHSYDLWVYYTGRTNGGYCRVEIDDAQELVNEIADPAGLGYKAFATYAANDLTRRQSIKVASGLQGAHVIRLTNGGVANPGGNAIMIEAVGITGSLADSRILPPAWSASTQYTMGDEVQHGGLFYTARATGVSGSAGPTHSGGIASDGALDWRADNRPTYPNFVAIDYASEREYAAEFAVAGNTTDLGGQTHGNESLISRSIQLDGVSWVPGQSLNGLSVGAEITMVENTTWQRSEGGDIGECQLRRVIAPGEVRHDVTLIATASEVDFAWVYTGMVPLVHWDGETKTKVFDTVEPAQNAMLDLDDYDGVNPPNIVYDDVERIGLSGKIFGNDLSYGHEIGKLAAGDELFGACDAILRPNINASSASGSTDWMAKLYASSGPFQMVAGDTLGFYSRHVMKTSTAAS
ncbi:hypothetical protein [Loktanella sp. S4079]|uniref:hypothetical protein n=1 Tax=Loktanella sp. S4079 TaxID=579483 RepID=UPI0005F9B83F|nr:hypothetical protein [Loktanella sp. S4079]KJZ20672.1 hypothetical protein TW80_07840 [Loktanella sp. S4079]